MLRAYNIKIYPTKKQQIYLNNLFGSYRKVYNLCLDKAISDYKNEGKSTCSLASLTNYFHRDILKNEEYFYLKEHNTKILKDSISNLSKAYSNFFKLKKGFPKFKRKDNEQKVSLYKEAFSKKIFDIRGKLFISNKFGYINYLTSDEYKKIFDKYKSNIVRLTIVKTKTDEYFVRVLIDSELTKQIKKSNNIVGLDLGIKDFIITSEGETYNNKHFYKKEELKIKKLQRQLSKKVKGGKNRNKTRKKLARLNNKIRNRRLNHIHLITTQLLNENQVIIIEDLNVSGMMKNHKLAKSIQEMSFSEFRRILEYKSKWYNRKLIVIDRWFPSSKLCNVCNYKNNSLSLSEREWTCPQCGIVHNRDYNAALNIKDEGIRILNG